MTEASEVRTEDMSITCVRLHQVDIPLKEPFVFAISSVDHLARIIVEVETDSGIVGWGEAAPSPEVTGDTQDSIMAVLENELAPLLLRKNPLASGKILSEMKARLGGVPSAIAGIEIALQDIRGKKAGLPLYQLLGSNGEESLRAPKVLSIKDPEVMADEAKAATENGYNQVKIKVGLDPGSDIQRVKHVAEVLPQEVLLKADANQGWGDAKTALQVLTKVENDLDVIEQPVSHDNIEDLTLLRERLSIPVMPDESVKSPADVSRLIRQNAGDIYNIKLMKTGGIDDATKLNHTAEAANRPTQIGSNVEGHIGTAAGVHFALSSENIVFNEMVGPFMAKRGISDLSVDEPVITAEGPGLGITIDESSLSEVRNRVTEIS